MQPSHLLINSKDKDHEWQSHSDFTVSLPYYIQGSSNMVLVSAMIPNTFYNIMTDYNDSFIIDSNNVVIPAGCYTLPELGATLQTLIRALGPSYSTFVVGFDNILMKGFFQNTSNFVFDFTNKKLADLLGFRKFQYNSVNQLLSDFSVDINTHNVLIHLDVCSNMLTTNKNSDGASFILCNNTNRGEYLIHFDRTCDQQVSLAKSNLFNKIKITLTNYDGKILENCGPWYFKLQFQFRSDVNIKLCNDSN